MNTQVIQLDPATEIAQSNLLEYPSSTNYYIPEGSAMTRVKRQGDAMYFVSGGYVETSEYVDGGQKIVYEIIPKEKTWAIEKSSSFLIEGRYGH